MRRNWWKWAAALLAGALLVWVAFPRSPPIDKNARANQAMFQASRLVEACEAYREAKYSEREYPATLADLLTPPFGGPPFLLNGAEGLIDPWGKPYRFAVIRHESGGTEVYVWAERTVDGRTRLFGAKRTDRGTIELFGG